MGLKPRSVSKTGAFPAQKGRGWEIEKEGMREDVGSGDRQLCGLSTVGAGGVLVCGDGGQKQAGEGRVRGGGCHQGGGQREAWVSQGPWAPPPCPTHSQMKVPWGMVCRARTPQPILAVR